MHDEARLHADRGAVAGIDPLDLPGDQAVAHVSDAGAAVAVDGGPEEPALSHLANDRRVEAFSAVRLQDARHQRALRVVARGVPDQALVLGKRALQQQRVAPVEARRRGVQGGSDVFSGLGHGVISLDTVVEQQAREVDDIDVAVAAREPIDPRCRPALNDAIAGATGRPAGLVDPDRAGPLLPTQALTGG